MSQLDAPIDRSQYQFPAGSIERGPAAVNSERINPEGATQILGETARRLAASSGEMAAEQTPLYYETAFEMVEREYRAIQEFLRLNESIEAMRQKSVARKQKTIGILKRSDDEILRELIEMEAVTSEVMLDGVPEGQTHRFYRANEDAFYWTQAVKGSKTPFKVIRYEVHPHDSNRMMKVQTRPGTEGVIREFVSHDELLLLVHWGNRYEDLIARHVHMKTEPRHRKTS